MNIYVDGVFDLTHAGHVKAFKYIKEYYKNCNLTVGVMCDDSAEKYKRRPIINEDDRCEMISSIKYVDRVLFPSPLIVTSEFLVENNIDLVVHGFSNKNDKDKQHKFFKDVKKLGKFEEIPYTFGISTSNIIKKIKDNY